MEDEILDVMNYLIEEIENNLDKSSSKRDNDSEKVLNDLECLAHQVEERLQAIENTERELDQWRDQQLQKNRDFWDGIEFNLLSQLISLFLLNRISSSN
jgi:hypothetical protein